MKPFAFITDASPLGIRRPRPEAKERSRAFRSSHDEDCHANSGGGVEAKSMAARTLPLPSHGSNSWRTRTAPFAFITLALCLAKPLVTSAAEFEPPIVLESPNGSPEGWFGAGSVSAIPDVNGDGKADIVVCAVGEPGGRVYLFDGATRELLRELKSPNENSNSEFGSFATGIDDLNGNGRGEAVVGTSYGEKRIYVFDGATGEVVHSLQVGTPGDLSEDAVAVSALPDVNGDGLMEFAVGRVAWRARTGSVHIYDGATGTELRSLNGPGFFGFSVSGIPDVNGDGAGDVIVGAWMANQAFIHDGATGGRLHTLTGSGQFGRSVAGLEDINGDGRGDVVVGAQELNRAYIYDGATGTLLHTLSAPGNPFRYGWEVNRLPDVDGDARDEVVVAGFHEYDLSRVPADAYVFSGGSGELLATLPGHSEHGMDRSIAGLPDVNGDGLAEVLIASPLGGSSTGVSQAGQVSLYLSVNNEDSDGDGLLDIQELEYFGSLTETADGDFDGDTLTNGMEIELGTDPSNADTDEDGLPDNVETNAGIYVDTSNTGTDPLNPDTDGDGLLDGVENPLLAYDPSNAANQPGTDPNDADTDDDLIDDGQEIADGTDPTVDGGSLLSRYEQDFEFADATIDLGDGTIVGGTAEISNGALQVSHDGTNQDLGWFKIPRIDGMVNGFTINFDLTMVHSSSGSPADGLSINVGRIPFDDVSGPTGPAEEGWGTHDQISCEIDAFGGDRGIGISTTIGGSKSSVAFTGGNILNSNSEVNATVEFSWDPETGASLKTNGLVTDADFVDIPTPDFAVEADFIVAIAGRTGGFTVDALVDNLIVQPMTSGAGGVTITLSSTQHTYDGEAKAVVVTTDPPGLNLRITYNGEETLPIDAGSYAVLVTVEDDELTGSAEGTLTINKASQSLSVEAPDSLAFEGTSTAISASSDAGLPVELSLLSGPARLENSSLTPTGVGMVQLQATQGGNENIEAAEPVTIIIEITAPPEQHFSGNEGEAISIPLLANGVSGLEYSFPERSDHGNFEMIESDWFYRSDLGFGGEDGFHYTVIDMATSTETEVFVRVSVERTTGTLIVRINLPDGGWKLAGEPTFRSEQESTVFLASGEHQVMFQDVSGYATPEPATVVLSAGGEVTVDGTYQSQDPYQIWLGDTFTPEQLADAAVSGREADIDRDGFPTIAEWALRLDPFLADVLTISREAAEGFSPHVQVVGEGEEQKLLLTFLRRTDHEAQELAYGAEFSMDLIEWSAGVLETVVPVDEDWEQVTIASAVESGEVSNLRSLFVHFGVMSLSEDD